MRTFTNECVSCPTEMGCLGLACPNINVEHFICDECEDETTLYDSEFGELCESCLLNKFPIIEGSK